MTAQRIRARSILREAFAVVGSLYVPLLIINFPSLVVGALNIFGKQLGSAGIPLNIIYWFVAAPLLSGTLIFYTYRNVTGSQVTIGEAFDRAYRKFLQLLLAWIMMIFLVSAGFIALIIPGVYLSNRLGFSLYATAIDGISALDSVSSSWKLTKGRWWLVFRSIVVMALVTLVPITLIVLLIDPSGKSPAAQLVSSVLGFLVGPLMSVNLVLLYRHLRDSAKTIS
ncbi:MAG: hypothetical protein MUE44_04100 [Oscillatoriaceae cyanobacterium Prado104]|jgi:hypothetical protein|nr:hypothetical protein [Oscillatoriaceae cyanobacterium Prado104]